MNPEIWSAIAAWAAAVIALTAGGTTIYQTNRNIRIARQNAEIAASSLEVAQQSAEATRQSAELAHQQVLLAQIEAERSQRPRELDISAQPAEEPDRVDVRIAMVSGVPLKWLTIVCVNESLVASGSTPGRFEIVRTGGLVVQDSEGKVVVVSTEELISERGEDYLQAAAIELWRGGVIDIEVVVPVEASEGVVRVSVNQELREGMRPYEDGAMAPWKR